ncbi:hypothetical protein CTAYLR_001462 [Chrysophaeum taylorii]|uniref:Glycine transporter domain-containing protein n=1 Tax=Chrysophaeum taylorii TaxID=2483200 RepID=A0AAD7U9M8_9STRA|nr:hypothetical protein CTAYLR_001462 [Chrysophaeum taylorii]
MFVRRGASMGTEAIRARRRAGASWRRLEPKRHGTDDELVSRVSELGVPMSQREMEALATATRRARRGDGGSRREFRKMVRERVEAEAERQALAEIILRADERTVAQQLLRAFDYVGTALFAMSGTLVAGEAGMHVVGASLVGCAASMGGGTINNIIMGSTAGGVFWIREPTYLLIAVCASVITFYSWPSIELELAKREMHFDFPPETLAFPQFKAALDANPAFEQRLRRAVADQRGGDDPSPRQIFDWLDSNADGALQRDELLVFARRHSNDSLLVFAVESLALGTFAVSGAQSAIVRGLHPIACAAAGVTVVSGGIFRDILCHRPSVALSAESFALATGVGAGTYVFLRHLLVSHGWPLPLGLRILLAASATISIRAAAWHRKPDSLLSPMANFREASEPGGTA